MQIRRIIGSESCQLFEQSRTFCRPRNPARKDFKRWRRSRHRKPTPNFERGWIDSTPLQGTPPPSPVRLSKVEQHWLHCSTTWSRSMRFESTLLPLERESQCGFCGPNRPMRIAWAVACSYLGVDARATSDHQHRGVVHFGSCHER